MNVSLRLLETKWDIYVTNEPVWLNRSYSKNVFLFHVTSLTFLVISVGLIHTKILWYGLLACAFSFKLKNMDNSNNISEE